MKNETYIGSGTVTVDEKTADFVKKAEEEAAKRQLEAEKSTEAKLNQEMFFIGTLDFLNGMLKNKLYNLSPAYFLGYSFGCTAACEIEKKAEEHFPEPDGAWETKRADLINAIMKEKQS